MDDFASIEPRFKNPYKGVEVILGSISDNIQNDQNLEPQMVRIRAQNNGVIFLDSAFKGERDSETNFVLKTTARKIKRLAVGGMQICLDIPNVNQRNNIVGFFSTNSASNHFVRVPQGFYTTPTTLMTALVTALNTASGASGLTWSFIPDAGDRIAGVTLSTAGGSFHFLNDSTIPTGLAPLPPLIAEQIHPISFYVKRGTYLWNLPITTFDSSIKAIGPICLQYTRYIDFESFALSQYTKAPMLDSKDGATDIIFRVFLNVGEPKAQLISASTPLRWTNYNMEQTLATVDFRILDEWNDEVFLPFYSASDGETRKRFDFIMILLTEI